MGLSFGEKIKIWTWSKYIYRSFSKLFSNYFNKVQKFGSQIIFKSILEVYFIFRYTEEYILSTAQFQKDKILVEVYVIYGTMA